MTRRGARLARPLGFTFVELMLTLALMAVLASVAVPMLQVMHQRQREQALAAALREIRQALDEHRRAADQGRIAVRAGDSGFPRSLTALVDGVVDERSPQKLRIYFLRRLPRDPMVVDGSLSAEQTWGKRSYASPPDDPREGDDVFDVFSRAPGTGRNGIAYREW